MPEETEPYYGDDVPQEILEKLRETNAKAELFRQLINPDYKEPTKGPDGLNQFTKEMKVSNIQAQQVPVLAELTLLAQELTYLKAPITTAILKIYREAILSLNCSVGGMYVKAMNTEYQFRKIDTPRDKARGLFRKKESMSYGPDY
jgi:5'-deoxynucleotidase YfbR-like HD superfamily hydrolase